MSDFLISTVCASGIEAHLAPARRVVRHAWRNGSTTTSERLLAEEVAVAFSYDGQSHAVLMATPDNLDDFAVGFSITEGIVGTPAEISELNVISTADGIVLRMWLTDRRSDALAARRRRFVGHAGCGMCGLESLAEANRALPVSRHGLHVTERDIQQAVAALPRLQTLNVQTRAVHAAAFWQPGHDLLVREDVGRHNALDKLAGALLRDGRSAAEGIVVLSSRISIELVQKAAMIGAAVVVGISAPTALAVRTAEAVGISLVGIARDDGFDMFTHADAINSPGASRTGF
jgi:FdhD protein